MRFEAIFRIAIVEHTSLRSERYALAAVNDRQRTEEANAGIRVVPRAEIRRCHTASVRHVTRRPGAQRAVLTRYRVEAEQVWVGRRGATSTNVER